MPKCPWCGNSSGKMDRRGMCISCGGALEIKPAFTQEIEKYTGHSGSLSYSRFPSHVINHGYSTIPMIGYYRGKPIDTLSDEELTELEAAKAEWKGIFYSGYISEFNSYA